MLMDNAILSGLQIVQNADFLLVLTTMYYPMPAFHPMWTGLNYQQTAGYEAGKKMNAYTCCQIQKSFQNCIVCFEISLKLSDTSMIFETFLLV